MLCFQVPFKAEYETTARVQFYCQSVNIFVKQNQVCNSLLNLNSWIIHFSRICSSFAEATVDRKVSNKRKSDTITGEINNKN